MLRDRLDKHVNTNVRSEINFRDIIETKNIHSTANQTKQCYYKLVSCENISKTININLIDNKDTISILK